MIKIRAGNDGLRDARGGLPRQDPHLGGHQGRAHRQGTVVMVNYGSIGHPGNVHQTAPPNA